MATDRRVGLASRLRRAVNAARRELRTPPPVTWHLVDPRIEEADFAGQTVLITGAAGLIGAGLVEAFLARGAVVHAVDRDGPGLQALAARNALGTPGALRVHVVDLSRPAAATELNNVVARLNVLVHCAGLNDRRVGVETLTHESWHEVLDANLVSPSLITAAFADKLSQSPGRASVLFVTSVNADIPSRWLHYAAAKAAEAKFMKDLAGQWAPQGIRVNAVAPAWTTDAGLEAERRSAGHHPLGHSAVPVEAIVHAVLFLSDSARSPMTTGQQLVIDGGKKLHTRTL